MPSLSLCLEVLEDRCLLSFGAAIPLSAGEQPSFVTTADFDGDGRLDLAVVNQTTPGAVCVLAGKADGTFQPARVFAAGDNAGALTVGDFNGDGRLDLAVAEPAGRVSVRLGNGDGTFATAQSFAAGPRATTLVTGDFNGDGRLDLAVVNDAGVSANPGERGVSVLVGNGDGSFATLPPLPVGLSAISLGVADVDEDHIPDLVVAQADFDKVSVLVGNGDGTFHVGRSFAVGGDPQSMVTADFNHDGHLDVAVANGLNVDASVLLGNGDGSFKPVRMLAPDPGSGYHAVVAADFDRDGQLDLALAGCPGFVLVLKGDGTGAFPTLDRIATGVESIALTAGDFNGDGQLDLAASSVTGNCTSLLLTHSPSVTTVQGSVVGQQATFTATVRASGTSLPTGKVQFLVDGVVVDTVDLQNGVATLATTLPAGNHAIIARFCGDNNFDGSDASTGIQVEPPSSSSPSSSTGGMVQAIVTPSGLPDLPWKQRFLTQTYLDLLGRPVDPSGLSHWNQALVQGASPTQVLQAIAGSLEFRTRQVQDIYHRLLHRDADVSGLRSFTTVLANGGTDEQVAALVAGSPEFLQTQGAGGTDGFLSALFQAALGRDVDAFGRTAFRQALAGGATRQQVADAIFASAEYRDRLVRGFYERFLQRDADAAGLRNHVNALAQGQRQEQVMIGFLASAERLGRL